MMLTLILNVLNHCWDIRFAYCERAVSILPPEVPQRREFFVNPFGRVAFEELRNLKGSDCWRCSYQRMDVVFDASNLQGGQPVRASNATDIFPYPLFNLRHNPALTILR